jgi:hypothetical protein
MKKAALRLLSSVFATTSTVVVVESGADEVDGKTTKGLDDAPRRHLKGPPRPLWLT